METYNGWEIERRYGSGCLDHIWARYDGQNAVCVGTEPQASRQMTAAEIVRLAAGVYVSKGRRLPQTAINVQGYID